MQLQRSLDKLNAIIIARCDHDGTGKGSADTLIQHLDELDRLKQTYEPMPATLPGIQDFIARYPGVHVERLSRLGLWSISTYESEDVTAAAQAIAGTTVVEVHRLCVLIRPAK